MKHKILWSHEDLSIRIFDENNYAIFREGKPKSYFNSIESAVKEVCRHYANRDCTDMTDWLEHYTIALKWFAEHMPPTARRSALERPKPSKPAKASSDDRNGSSSS